MYQIRKTEIVRRLVEALDLEPGLLALIMSLVPTLQLTLDVDDLLSDVLWVDKGLNLSGAGGTPLVAFTVPADERWTLLAWIFDAVVVSSSVWLFTPGGAAAVRLYVGTAADYQNSKSIPLEPGWTIRRYTTGDVGDAAVGSSILYRRRKIY